MRVTAYHDEQGNIVSLVACADNAPPHTMEVRPGLSASEVQVPDLTTGLESAQLHRRLAELRDSHRVEVSASTARLRPRAK
jgi:hypothetical protein